MASMRRIVARSPPSPRNINVRPVSLGRANTPAGEEGLQEPDGLQVSLDRTVRLVLGPEMPLEGAGQVG